MESKNVCGSIKTNKAEHIVHFPQEIIEGILLRLPVKSLLKFRCVSKSWRSLIGSECFIKAHLKNSREKTSLSHHRIILNPKVSDIHPHRVLMHCSWPSLLNEPIVDSFAFDGPFDNLWYWIKLVGCCDGLVCILLNSHFFFLWNPSTRMSKKLSNADNRLRGKIITRYGFGYDESSNDYKVFAVIYCHMTPRDGQRVISRIFSLKNNSWKTLMINEGDSRNCFGEAGKLASGNLHWAVNQDWEIVSFDLKNEVYGMIEQPSCSEEYDYKSLGVITGCLSVLGENRGSHSDIWVMKEYGVKESWVKLLTLPIIQHPGDTAFSMPFCSGPDGEIIQIYNCRLIIYYPKERVFRYPRITNVDYVLGAAVCIESLVSVASDREGRQPLDQ